MKRSVKNIIFLITLSLSIHSFVTYGFAYENHWFEAEYADSMDAPFAISDDGSASEGKYLSIPNGEGNYDSPGSIAAVYEIEIAQAGDYVLWGRVIAPTGEDDSFYIQMDDGEDNVWDVLQGSSWGWDQTNNRDVADPVVFFLTAGHHTLRIKPMEDGTQIDKLLLTNDAEYIPTGFGEPAENLPEPLPDLVVTSITTHPAMPTPGEEVSIEVKIKNQGTGNANGFRIDWYADAGTSPSLNEHGDAGEDVTSLAPGAEYTMVATYTGYSSPGAYSMWAQVDTDGSVEESNEANNILGPQAIFAAEIENHWFEAEYADSMDAPFAISDDGSASEGKYLSIPNGEGNYDSPGSIAAVYEIEIAQAGDYVLWGRVIAPTGEDDSFYIQMDDGEDNVWDVLQGSSWGWDQTNNRDVADPVVFFLTAGHHTLRIKPMEDGTQIDKLLLTNDAEYIPTGFGEPAENLPEPLPDLVVTSITTHPAMPTPGEEVSIEVKIKNQGTGNANGFRIDWYADAGTSPSLNEHGDAGEDVTSLAPGAEYTMVATYTGYSSPGAYSMWAQVDTDGSVEESNEANNILGPQAIFAAEIENHWFEAEYADSMDAPFAISDDGSASEGKYLSIPNGEGNYDSPGSIAAVYEIEIAQAGDYVLWGRVIAPTGEDDSFYIQMDDGEDNVWDVLQGSSWGWDQTNNRDVADPVVFFLTAGHHTLRIKPMEDGTQIDKLLLTNDAEYIPTGFGEPAENLPEPLPDLVVTSITTHPAMPTPGEEVSIEVKMKNQGTGNANGFRIDWYADAGTSPSLNEHGDAGEDVTSLAPGAEYTMVATYTGYSSPGAYSMWAQVDTDGSVEESNEANNILGPQAIFAAGIENHWLEAENADSMDAPFTISDDGSASEGKYLSIPNGRGSYYTPVSIETLYEIKYSPGRRLCIVGEDNCAYRVKMIRSISRWMKARTIYGLYRQEAPGTGIRRITGTWLIRLSSP